MKPKDKAKELVDKMYNTPHCGIEHFPSKHYCDCSEIGFFQAKQCALIALDEIFQFMKMDDDYTKTASNANSIWVNYFIEVKQEIEKL